jgi:hypothetical protein
MHAGKFVAADDNDGVLGEKEERERLERDPLEGAHDVAPGRELKFRVAALGRFSEKRVATPLNSLAVAVGNADQPAAVADFAGILLVVDPHVEGR